MYHYPGQNQTLLYGPGLTLADLLRVALEKGLSPENLRLRPNGVPAMVVTLVNGVELWIED